MEIRKADSNHLKITLGKNDMDKMNISFDSFAKNSPQSQLFLANLLEIIKETDVIKITGGSVAVDVAQQKNGSMVIYLSFERKHKKPTKLCYPSEDPIELTTFVRNLLSQYREHITDDCLYLLNNKYFLVFETNYAKSTARKKDILKDCVNDLIIINKIAEYGQLLSDTPLKTLNIRS